MELTRLASFLPPTPSISNATDCAARYSHARTSSWSPQPPKTNSCPKTAPERRPTDPRIPDRSGGRAADEGRHGQPPRPPGCHDDPSGLQARPHLSMTFKQTTHFAVLLSLLESWKCVTE